MHMHICVGAKVLSIAVDDVHTVFADGTFLGNDATWKSYNLPINTQIVSVYAFNTVSSKTLWSWSYASFKHEQNQTTF